MEHNFRKYALFFVVSHKTLLWDFEYHLALGYFRILKAKCIQYKALMVFSLFCHLGNLSCVSLGTPLKVSVITKLCPESGPFVTNTQRCSRKAKSPIK